MKLHIENIQHHRNGICGAPFHVLIFGDPDEGRMLGIVFGQEYHVAVLNLDKLAGGDIAFGVNSWRGDRYEPHLRNAIALHNEMRGDMTTIFPTCALAAIESIRDALADEDSFHVPSSVIEWLDQQIEQHEIDLHALLAQRKQIALIWCIEDVQAVRPDLTDEQAWEVLQQVKRHHDANLGINWQTLECFAEDLFGDAPETDEE